MIILFRNLGKSLGTRALGETIREETILMFKTSEKVTFDFRDIEIISNSFADECFGKMVEMFGLEYTKSKTTFVNTNEDVSFVIRKSIMDRIKKNNQCI